MNRNIGEEITVWCENRETLFDTGNEAVGEGGVESLVASDNQRRMHPTPVGGVFQIGVHSRKR